MSKGITPKNTDYSRWYTDIITKAEMADYGPVKGTMVVKPYGFSLWTNIRDSLNKMIDLSNQTSNDSIDLILWPESNISNLFVVEGSYNSNLSLNMNQFLENVQFSLVAGSDLRLSDKKYNSSILFFLILLFTLIIPNFSTNKTCTIIKFLF